MKKNFWEGAQPLPKQVSHLGGGHRPQTQPPRRLRRLHPRTFGARPAPSSLTCPPPPPLSSSSHELARQASCIHLPEHASLDLACFARYFHRLHVEENRFLVVDVGSRQQRVNQYSTSRVDEERVGQLTETKVDDFAEERVDLHVRTSDSLDFAEHEHGQAFGNYQSYNNNDLTIIESRFMRINTSSGTLGPSRNYCL